MRVAVAVLVLGDFARSPRMVYHVRSLIANGFDVDVVAYAGSELPVDLTHHQSRIKWHLKPPPTRLDAGSSSRLAFLLYAIGKVVTQIFTLLWTFLYCMQHSDYILVQVSGIQHPFTNECISESTCHPNSVCGQIGVLD